MWNNIVLKWVKYFYPETFMQKNKKRHTRETWFILLLRVTNTSFVFILFILTQFCYPFSASSLMLRVENCYMYTLYECKFFKEYEPSIDIEICTFNVTILIMSLFWISVLLHRYNNSFNAGTYNTVK